MNQNDEQLWTLKGATLSDKSACKEYKLTREEIIKGINEGKLHYRENYVYGTPWFRLLRPEVEKYVQEIHGNNHLQVNKLKTQLKQIETQIKQLKSQTMALEIRKAEIRSKLDKFIENK